MKFVEYCNFKQIYPFNARLHDKYQTTSSIYFNVRKAFLKHPKKYLYFGIVF